MLNLGFYKAVIVLPLDSLHKVENLLTSHIVFLFQLC